MEYQYQLMPSLTEEEYQLLKADIAERGVQVPIEFDEKGNILDGHHRMQACAELGIKNYPSIIRPGLTEEEKTHHVLSINLARRHLEKEQRRELVGKLRKLGWSTRKIAEVVKVDFSTVSRDLSGVANATPERIIGKDGKSYQPYKFEAPEIPQIFKICPSCKNLLTDDFSICPYCDVSSLEVKGSDIAKAKQAMQITTYSHQSLEYYTPKWVIDAAREVMGWIDLDPASCKEAQENVQAVLYYTIIDDGLSRDWYGKVWMNPPYSKTDGRSNQDIWTEHLISEYENSNVTEAIFLVKAALGYKWFESLFERFPVCFLRERLSFILDDGNDDGQSKQGTAIFYLGDNFDKFYAVFRKYGRVIPSAEVLDESLFRQ